MNLDQRKQPWELYLFLRFGRKIVWMTVLMGFCIITILPLFINTKKATLTNAILLASYNIRLITPIIRKINKRHRLLRRKRKMIAKIKTGWNQRQSLARGHVKKVHLKEKDLECNKCDYITIHRRASKGHMKKVPTNILTLVILFCLITSVDANHTKEKIIMDRAKILSIGNSIKQHRLPLTVKNTLTKLGIAKNIKTRKILKRRAGKQNVQAVFLNANSKGSAKFKAAMNEISNNSIIFLSETMTLKEKQSSLWPNKRMFDVHAFQNEKKTGRPMQGMEMYISQEMSPCLLNKSNKHIAVSMGQYVIIGVYYHPDLDITEVIEDIQYLMKISEGKHTLISGDFNVHPESDKMVTILDNFETNGITMKSDKTIPTYEENGRKSTNDYVFSNFDLIRVNVKNRLISDHYSMEVKFKMPAKKNSKVALIKNTNYKANYEEISNDLDSIEVEKESGNENIGVVEDLERIFDKNNEKNFKIQIPRKSKSQDWYTAEHYEFKKQTLRAFNEWKNTNFHSVAKHETYKECKRKYHKQTRAAEKQYKYDILNNALKESEQDGIKSVYKIFKNTNASSTVDMNRFRNFYTTLLNRDGPFDIEKVYENKQHPLLQEISETEIKNAIKSMKSKAKSTGGLSPNDMKSLHSINEPLRVIFNMAIRTGKFPVKSWLESAIFFLYKKGDAEDPTNYRSINIMNPIIKIFTHILSQRLTEYSEEEGLIPNFQFGYRKGMSTTGAAATLYKVINSRLNRPCKKSLRTYAVFVDFSKCFDSVNRKILYHKLQKIGIPYSFCKIMADISMNTKCYIKSGDLMAEPFTTTTGVLQGCSLSSICFSLFVADLPNALLNLGPKIGKKCVNFIQYADDLVILSRTRKELDKQIQRMTDYCIKNELTINAGKTEALIFYKGQLPNDDKSTSFSINQNKIETVTRFKYLGFIFTTQLSFTEHAKKVCTKANAKIGYIFSKLKSFNNVSVDTAIRIYDCYVLPSFLYGLPIWLDSCSKASIEAINCNYSKYLKRYLGVMYTTNTAIVHFITKTLPISEKLKDKTTKLAESINLQVIKVLEEPFINKTKDESTISPQEVIKEIPTYFWRSRVISYIPSNANARKNACCEITDQLHNKICSNKDFHLARNMTDACTCIQCGEVLEHYHLNFDCNPFKTYPSEDIFQ